MVIQTTTNNNQTIVKQLTELMNQAFDYTVTKTLARNKAMIELKEHSSINDSFEKRGQAFETLFELINDWGNNSYYEYVRKYANVMSEPNRAVITCYLVRINLDYCLDQKTVLAYEEQNFDLLTLYEVFRLSKPSSDKNHPVHKDTTVNSLLDDYKNFDGTAEQAVLSIIKPLLINGLIEDLIKHLGAITELVEVINNYQDNNYHLNRFIKALEKGMIEDNSHPLEFSRVWLLWDEQFLKETAIPLLKNQQITEKQLKKLPSYKDESVGVNNYYDYCLAYYRIGGYCFPEFKKRLLMIQSET